MEDITQYIEPQGAATGGGADAPPLLIALGIIALLAVAYHMMQTKKHRMGSCPKCAATIVCPPAVECPACPACGEAVAV